MPGQGLIQGAPSSHDLARDARRSARRARPTASRGHPPRQTQTAIRYKHKPVRLELLRRKKNFDVVEVPESVTNLLSQVPREVLDLVVDSKGRKLITHPAHGGEPMSEEY